MVDLLLLNVHVSGEYIIRRQIHADKKNDTTLHFESNTFRCILFVQIFLGQYCESRSFAMPTPLLHTTSAWARHDRSGAEPHCRVLPPGEFNRMIPELLPVCSE